MSGYELISPEDYAALPEDIGECFVALEAICHRNMMAVIGENTSGDFDGSVRMDYAATITAFAEECGFTVVAKAYSTARPSDITNFLLVVRREVARIRFRNRGIARSASVLLVENTKTKIEHYISRLDQLIEASDLPEPRKRVLAGKLLELRAELTQPRLTMGKAFAVLSAVLVAFASMTTVAAEGPNAITHIMQLIGKDRETEEAAARRLAPPPKALPAPSLAEDVVRLPSDNQILNQWQTDSTNELDDEIPF